MYRRRYSLIFQIALPFALLLVLTMGALSIYLSTFIQQTYLEMLRENLVSETQLIADRLAVAMEDDSGADGTDGAEIKARAQQYAESLNVRVTIISPTGVVLGESEAEPEEMENHLDRPEIQRALNGQAGTEIRYSSTLQTEMLYSAAPIEWGGEVIGAARTAVPLAAIRRADTQLQRTILIATGIATLLTILVGLLVAAYTVYPLKRLTNTAQRVARGELVEIASPTRQDEVGQLQQSIQQMAYHLRAQINDLSTERSKLEAVLSNMTDGIIIVDPEGVVQLTNPAAARLFGAEAGEMAMPAPDGLVGRSLIEVVRSHQVVELWRKCRATGEQQSLTLETTPERLFVQAIVTPLEKALPNMTLLVFQDLTRVRRLETVRRDFVSNVSHELRTPLASLKALAETLQEGALEDPPAARRFLQRMETEIDNLTQMVHELLELSRIESNKVPLKMLAVTPCELASPAVERMQLQAERAGLRLSMDCPESLPRVKADPQRIAQVLVNLIHNAIKFTSPGGAIHISARQQEKQVIFSIRDTGAGIPPDVLPRIFERFYKVDRARSGGGTGLGLSIARHIIEAHGGKIWADSTVKAGSTFFFSLPIA